FRFARGGDAFREAGGELGARSHGELAKERADVRRHRAFGDAERLGDLLVGAPGEQLEDDAMLAVRDGKVGVGGEGEDRHALLAPQILEALARAGHGSRVLIADGNYPHWTKRGRNASVVFLNLAPGVASATDVLRAMVGAIPLEAASVMAPASGPDPDIWRDF